VKAGKLNVSDAARALGVAHTTVYRTCAALGIDPAQARGAYLLRVVKVAARIGGGWPRATLNERSAWRHPPVGTGRLPERLTSLKGRTPIRPFPLVLWILHMSIYVTLRSCFTESYFGWPTGRRARVPKAAPWAACYTGADELKFAPKLS
jgi:hypothetical protein